MTTSDALYGYTSRMYETVEDLAEHADWTGGDEQDKAINVYLNALHALAAARTAEAADQETEAEPQPDQTGGVKAVAYLDANRRAAATYHRYSDTYAVAI